MTTDPATAARLVDELVALMQLEPLGGDRFLAQSEDIGTPAVFGGQVLGQSLAAASLTVGADRPVHSMHAYFLLPGEHAPIEYSVDRVRDGRSFTTRHVVARQGERIIFEMSASFQTVDDGVEHQLAMPAVEGPEGLVSELDQRLALGDRLPERWRIKGLEPHGIEYRRVEADDLLTPIVRPSESAIWMRAIAPLPDDPVVHRALLAYASDHGLLRAAMLPHGLSFMSGQVRPASLDHAMWFHRDFRMDDWLLYVLDSPSASGARGLCRGSLFTRDGRLVASTAQEGMLRIVR
ncbi:acyl-CoA thioesterase-2 [Variovorax boronicumulans]|uniref:acyl-CoA thioesterase n=1 Tax=Variovorax boronicumulans TaxID=436515 RepID=UPI0027873DE7|nr:acyl-CoA thioesterase II [Variovorax boronicumulans]MDP9996202.1 acyl-CoA thioesterase-2 [Variovorax boronicumulans]MDQ0007369.1 acyl-CoA thioesterase-2 [Variovorax boronicumulans]MDQ0033945.1 acyl-CoA thioesterase-2 [Variovorax boronicumulans]